MLRTSDCSWNAPSSLRKVSPIFSSTALEEWLFSTIHSPPGTLLPTVSYLLWKTESETLSASFAQVTGMLNIFQGNKSRNLSSNIFSHPPATPVPFFTPLSAHFLKKAIYSYWLCLSTLTPQLLATCFNSYFSSVVDPSKASGELPGGKFNDLSFHLHLGQLCSIGISASYFPILCSPSSQDTPFPAILIQTLSPCSLPPLTPLPWALCMAFFKALSLPILSPLTFLFQDFNIHLLVYNSWPHPQFWRCYWAGRSLLSPTPWASPVLPSVLPSKSTSTKLIHHFPS